MPAGFTMHPKMGCMGFQLRIYSVHPKFLRKINKIACSPFWDARDSHWTMHQDLVYLLVIFDKLNRQKTKNWCTTLHPKPGLIEIW